ncbi:MAG TPA: SPOR domain-containing protein [bacterium]
MATDPTSQLELFQFSDRTAPKPHRETLGWLQLTFRYDQLVLVGIGGLLALTAVFALGVERGKQLARTERALLVRRIAKPAAAPEPAAAAPAPAEEPAAPANPPALTAAQADATRYVVQVVTYSRPQLATRELERLRASGELAFLADRRGQTVLYVGPFESKDNAKRKLSTLRQTYRDCFMRTL